VLLQQGVGQVHGQALQLPLLVVLLVATRCAPCAALL
jgi:hypothetical protein